MIDYERTARGWEVFDCISGQVLATLPVGWMARLVCWALDRLR